ncbi:MAG TPA: 16S rRNA (cytosine(967)-C(5))-methyltransferase RsmB, partial [Firmicutes bacterium]|nr:16S rRNA (cytosine(967)-C(5))-methyltransferase RsmB [Bacillota bacterium]
LFYVQDESSMLVAHALNPQSNDMVLDTCAAPGGKTSHIAAMLNNTGVVKAHDIYEHKITLINENLTRLGLTNVQASLADASTLNE